MTPLQQAESLFISAPFAANGTKNGAERAWLKNRRRYPRFEQSEPVLGAFGPWYRRVTFDGRTENVSESGICFESVDRVLLGVGSTMRMRMKNGFGKEGQTFWASGTVVGLSKNSGGLFLCRVRFDKLLKEFRQGYRSFWDQFFFGIFIVLTVLGLFAIKLHHLQWFWYNPLVRLYSLLAATFIGTRLLLSIFYRSPKDQGYFPSVSVIIPVKDEEAHIAGTIQHCFQSRYPHDRFEVLVVDDGSTDGTWRVLTKLQENQPNLRLLQFKKNHGKRYAMATGAEAAKGEILIYVDSDSFIDPEGIYRIVQPFSNGAVGAVAGHTQVVVESTNVISKMEAVRYWVSHQLFKTAESLFGVVTCCPGAFSAYRKTSVMKVLSSWLHQTFLGTQATFGDDRSLTNYILRDFEVLYHAGAVCTTHVPNAWNKFFRQQLRWKKSWARETIIGSTIMYKKHPVAVLSYYVNIFLTLLSPFVFLRAVLYAPFVLSAPVGPYFTGLFLVYFSLCFIYFYRTRQLHWYCGLLFPVMYLSVLCWQTYYAIATVRRNHWGTR